MKRFFLMLVVLLLAVPMAFVAMQDAPALRMQITGINRTDFPTVVVNANVFDRVGQPLLGLEESNFAVVGELVDRMRVVKVENITDDSLSFSAVLAIDTSSSMVESPIERTKEAAISFVNSIGPNDPVAIVTFDSTERLIQDFTTDKELLISKINSLGVRGQTALYDGGLLAVQTAANSPIPRRAIVLLSDGAEYGGRSSSERASALSEALRVGVPVYTIGQGFGFDRSYLQELAEGTNAKFYESPSPDQLLEIYNGLASILRSQYIVTLESDLPGDGTVYALDLQATDTNGQSAQARTQLRAPIPVPIPSITGLPAEGLTEPTPVVGDALSDDGLATGQFQIDDLTPVVLDQSPFALTIDPAALSVGEHTLSFTATDSTGDSATTTQTFSVAPKPPVVTIDGLPALVSEPATATINAAALRGQIRSLIVKLNDQALVSSLNQSTTTVTIDPATLAPGTYTLTAVATDTDGSRTETTSTFEVAALPPTVAVVGLENGQTVSDVTEVTIDGASAQFEINGLIVKLNDQPLASLVNASSTTVTIDPNALQPGDNTLTAIARDTNGGRAQSDITFTVPAFAPRAINFTGLTAGETLDADRTVTLEVDSPQTPITAVVYTIDGTEVMTQTEEPFSIDLDVSALGAGSHILSVTATNAGGQSLTADTAFLIAEPPPATATAVPPTATSTTAPGQPTNTVEPTNTDVPQPTAENQSADASPTAVTQAQVATDVPTDVAGSPTDTAAVEPTNTEVSPTESVAVTEPATTVAQVPTNTSEPTATNTDVPPTATNTSEPTAANTDVPPTATDAVVPTDATEATAEATAEETAESTEAAAPAATNTTAATDTSEATAESNNTGTAVPTFTPIPLSAETQGTVGQAQSPWLIGTTCLLGLLLLGVIYWFAGRRRSADRRR